MIAALLRREIAKKQRSQPELDSTVKIPAVQGIYRASIGVRLLDGFNLPVRQQGEAEFRRLLALVVEQACPALRRNSMRVPGGPSPPCSSVYG